MVSVLIISQVKIFTFIDIFVVALFAGSTFKKVIENLDDKEEDKEDVKVNENTENKPIPMMNTKPDEEYSLFFVNDYWYYFFRLHHTLCERLSKMHKHAIDLAAEEASQKSSKANSASSLLRLKNQCKFFL